LNEDVMHIAIDKPRINFPHFIAIVVGALVNAFILGGVWVNLGNSIDKIDEKYDELSTRLDKEAADRQLTMNGVNVQIGQIPGIQFKQDQQQQMVAENKAGIAETNKRIDRVVESFGGKLDAVIDTINKVSTQVQVLNSKLDDLQSRPKRADLEGFGCPEDKPIEVRAYCRSGARDEVIQALR
jgi:hypothetical protein